MTTHDQLERDLTGWFTETAWRETPEAAADILIETSTTRQRPRWTFVPILPRPMERPLAWIPLGSTPARRLAVLVAIAALLALAAGALWIGSRPRVAPPFGPAANGLVAYAESGDIFVVDPLTGERTGLVVGPESDHLPRWSLDGTHLAFIRDTIGGSRLVVADAAGTVLAVSTGDPLLDVDPDGIRWAPDGRNVLVLAALAERAGVFLIDAATGQPTLLPFEPWGLESYWRPPDGRQLLFVGSLEGLPALHLYSLADGAVTPVPGTARAPRVRPVGWTPDGSRFAYHRSAATPTGYETAVVDVETGAEVVLDVAYGRISNDGTRIVGLAADGQREWLCVTSVDGGPCEPIEGAVEMIDPTGWASAGWTPDDRWIWSRPGDAGPAVLLDPEGGGPQWPPWAAEGANSWQRRAP
jgi:dipeptidyl aminopeptidase/acylaminoacyl peptidase